MRRLVPPFPRPAPGHFSLQFAVVIGTTGSYVSSVSIALPLRSPLVGVSRFHLMWWRGMQRRFPSSWGILVYTCPGLGTPAVPLNLALAVQRMLSSARLTASTSATTKDFGAESLAARVLAVYASHPSGRPGEWQDSLPACPLRL